MFDLKPMNKWIVIEPLKEDEKVGSQGLIIAPDNARERQHRMARIVAKDECEETKRMNVGDVVFYDRIGEVEGRVGKQSFVTVKAINVLVVVAQQPQKPVTKFKDILEVTGTPIPEDIGIVRQLRDVLNGTGSLDDIKIDDETKERLRKLMAKGVSLYGNYAAPEAIGSIELPPKPEGV